MLCYNKTLWHQIVHQGNTVVPGQDIFLFSLLSTYRYVHRIYILNCIYPIDCILLIGKYIFSMHDLIKRRHSVTDLKVHLVFTTKYRRKIFRAEHISYMETIISDVCIKLGVHLIEFNGEKDHVHLLLHYPPVMSVSVLVNSIKATSSRYLRKHYKELHGSSQKSTLWSRSYFACSVGGAPLEVLKQYIENQNSPQ